MFKGSTGMPIFHQTLFFYVSTLFEELSSCTKFSHHADHDTPRQFVWSNNQIPIPVILNANFFLIGIFALGINKEVRVKKVKEK